VPGRDSSAKATCRQVRGSPAGRRAAPGRITAILLFVALPRLLLSVIDPAGAYLGRPARRRRGPTYRGAAVFGPDVPGGSRQATPEEIDDLRRAAEEYERARCLAAVPVDRGDVERAVTDLLRTGDAVFGEGRRTVHARIVRFRRGSSVLEMSSQAGTSRRSSRTRIRRSPGPEDEQVLLDYLVSFVQHLDP
jgi:hypothetical protein